MNANTLQFFDKMGLDRSFLNVDPGKWEELESFRKASDVIKTLQVVNDLSERGVALIKELTAAALTKDEDQLQDIAQIVTKHRAILPKLDKACIVEASSSFGSVV